MADVRSLSASPWGDDLRRTIAARRLRRRCLGVAAVIALTAIPVAVSILIKPPVLLVWNASASAPIGLYLVLARHPVRRGDMVVAWAPASARTLAAARRYIPANVPLVKRVAAVSGDRVCAHGRTISINGRWIAFRRKSDAAGRPMTWWNGCRDLAQGQFFLTTESLMSFDGRYFGISARDDLVGRAVLLWAKPAKGSNDD